MQYLRSMTNDVQQMSELVHSLLLLARMNRVDSEKHLQNERVDEVIFDAYEKLKKQYPDFQMIFEIVEHDGDTPTLEVKAAKSLLEIAFFNLLKNAYLYADQPVLTVKIHQNSQKAPLEIDFINTGSPMDLSLAEKIFEPFVRGSNAQNTAGSGLGLRITKRILNYHHASIGYEFIRPNMHKFVVRF
jgi:K+-sensing histidine kinase KdpD